MPQAGYSQLKQNYDPDNLGAPGDRTDGTPRDLGIASTLIALTPLAVPAATLAAHPTFWAHVPADAGWVMLRLQDAQTQTPIAPMVAFPVGDGPGLMQLPWPESMPALEPDRLYRWTVVYCCSEELVRSQLAVTGTVIRRSAEGRTVPSRPGVALAWYIQQELWLDAIAIAAATRRTHPDRLTQQWPALLTHPAIDLRSVINAPISPCCSVDGR
jgi:hypothetical protein